MGGVVVDLVCCDFGANAALAPPVQTKMVWGLVKSSMFDTTGGGGGILQQESLKTLWAASFGTELPQF